MPESLTMTHAGAGRAALPAPRIAVLIPCYNEEVAIPRVVRRLPLRPARGDRLRLRQQQPRPHRGGRARGRRRACGREHAAGQGQRRAAHVRRRRGRRLRAGRRRRHLRGRRRAGDDPLLLDRAARHGDRRARDAEAAGAAYRPGHRFGNLPADRHGAPGLRRPHHRHALGLPRLLPPLREVLPRPGVRLRDRDRVHRPRAEAQHAGRRASRPATGSGRAGSDSAS